MRERLPPVPFMETGLIPLTTDKEEDAQRTNGFAAEEERRLWRTEWTESTNED